ncbi:MAG: hypothetical protein M0P64_00145 [Candidatus Pacebacteria bacterium]|jgi:hypothetical protein|nr:hypothetical protein [Candidatus Paceibacterota bacterium]
MERLSHTISRVREDFGAWLRVAIILGVLSFLFFVAGGGVSHNKKWQINQINVTGTDAGTADLVRSLVRQKLEGNYFFVYARNNSYLYPKRETEGMLLETFPRMKSVSVARAGEHTIAVTIVEREPYALWCGEKYRPELSSYPECYFIDSDGYVFDRSPVFSRGVYVVVYGKLIEKNEGEALRGRVPLARFVTADTFSILVREKIGKPFQIELKDDSEQSVAVLSSAEYPFLAEVVLRFKDDATPETLVKNILAALPVQFPGNVTPKKKLLYIDMRFGNKVIFGFEN